MKLSSSVDGTHSPRPADHVTTRRETDASDVEAGHLGTLLRSAGVFAAAGVSSLLLGSWLVSAGGTATYADAVRSYLRPAIYTSVLAALVLFVASCLLANAARRVRLFCHGGRARTGWASVFIALLSAGTVGAATIGSDGFTIGMLSASISGFPVFALVAGLLLGGPGLPGTRAHRGQVHRLP